jgi:hypothetical protein
MGPRPAYAAGEPGEHSLDVAGKGEHITRQDLRALAKAAGLRPAEIDEMIDRTLAVVADWYGLAVANGVDPQLAAPRGQSGGVEAKRGGSVSLALGHEAGHEYASHCRCQEWRSSSGSSIRLHAWRAWGQSPVMARAWGQHRPAPQPHHRQGQGKASQSTDGRAPRDAQDRLWVE